MTSPFPPPSPSEWGRDGTQPPDDDPPASSPTQYELYPPDGGWPDQPVTSAPYPHHPPAYAPPPPPPPMYQAPPPPVVQYPQPVMYPQPVVVQTRNNNKGWIIGGVIVLVVLLGCGGGWLALRGLINGVSGSDSGGSGTPMAYSTSVPPAPATDHYKPVKDYCGLVTSSRFTTTMQVVEDGTPNSSANAYGDGWGDGSCSMNFKTDDSSYDYVSFSMYVVLQDPEYVAQSFASEKSTARGTEITIDVGEKSYATIEDASSTPAVNLVVLGGNMLLTMRLYSSQDNATEDALKGMVQDTANEILTGMS